MARHPRFFLGLTAALGLLCCNSNQAPIASSPVASKLTRSLNFPHGMLINGPLPQTTDPRTTLLPLGPTVVVKEGAGSIMALEVDDPEQRMASATLLQFGDDSSHVRAPVSDSQGISVIENDFTANKTLCTGLCNAIFTVKVQEKVELSDGKISSETTRDVVVDCRKDGDPSACKAGQGADGGTGENGAAVLCGDVTKGEIALSGDPIIDAHLDAIRQLGKVTGNAQAEVSAALSAMATSLGIKASSSAADITSALTMRTAQQANAGLGLLLGQPGCAVRLEQVSLALRVCDPDGVASLDALQCAGTCEPGVDATACGAAASGGCRGPLDAGKCAARCLGACEIALTSPAACVGTCIGKCSGQCPSDGAGGCAGPCDALCTGNCRMLSSDVCAGDCTGLCDEPATGQPSCTAPLQAYCSPAMDGVLACPGDCFGTATVDKGSTACRASAIAVARSFPRCEAPLLQLSFAFKPGTTTADQNAFASLIHDLNPPLGHLYDALGRIDLLAAAGSDLAASAKAEVADELSSALGADPTDKGLMCAQQRLGEESTWLDSEQSMLASLKADVMQLLTTVTVMQ